MSLRIKLVAVLAAILAATMGVASWLAGRMAQRSVEEEIRIRGMASAQDLAAEITRSGPYDRKVIASRFNSVLRRHRGLIAAELALDTAADQELLRVTLGSGGGTTLTTGGVVDISPKASSALLANDAGRYWRLSIPLRVGGWPARLSVESSLAEADRLIAAEKRTFIWVTAAACALLVTVTHLLLLRLLGQPIGRLLEVMAAAEGGRLDAVADASSDDEIAALARGFNSLMARVRDLNRKLQGEIDVAVADLARKNRDLAELNDLLVAARRDLTAKERLAALGQLAGTIAHELGNPLNAINGHVQLLARRPDLPSSAREDLRVVHGEVSRMTEIIRRFLDSTRGLTPAPEPVDVPSLVSEAIDLTLSAEVRSRVQVQRLVEEGLDTREIDPGLVRHVLTNFIANAVDAMPQGGSLRVSARQEDAELLLSVKDSGRGIEPEDRKHIFEPFFTTKPKGQGTGLGLAICREIARALKGRIDVDTSVGVGSTFTLRFPLRQPPPSGPAPAGEHA